MKEVDLPPITSSSQTNFIGSGNYPVLTQLRMLDPGAWEDFILEWAHFLHKNGSYTHVTRCGGAGDMGRDIIAYNADGSWINYQCKHYEHPLRPSDVFSEILKHCYYTYKNEFPVPNKYYFVSPCGVGNTLLKLLNSPSTLKQVFCDKWPTKPKKMVKDAGLRQYVNGFDFSVFSYVPPMRLIEQHANTPYHSNRFGTSLPPRPPLPSPPDDVTLNESKYVSALFDAYTSKLKRKIERISDFAKELNISGHFIDCRKEFYCAESLRAFSRDCFPPGTYEAVLEETRSGIIDIVRLEHNDGYERVLKAVAHAKGLDFSASSLHGRIVTQDKGGMCHQLANQEVIKWT